MSLLISQDTVVVIQGITGKQGTKICEEMLDYGASVAAGVTPGKGGQSLHGVPVYNTVAEALDKHCDVNTSLICVPRESTKDAACEAIRSGGIGLVNILTEGMAEKDTVVILECAREQNVRVVGPASVGVICPAHRVKIGAIGGSDPGVFYPGGIAIFSKSGGMCLSLATEIFNRLGFGVSIVVGIGGDRIIGTSFKDILELYREDSDTKLVVLFGEVGGSYEEEAAVYIEEYGYPKPVIARMTGMGAEAFFPSGTRLGHAGSIVGSAATTGSFQSKVEAFQRAGVPVAKTSEELIELVGNEMPGKIPSLEDTVAGQLELVSIAKDKLESLKRQSRAVRIKTGLTDLVNGVPHFRGFSLPYLMRSTTIAEMIWMSLTQGDVQPDTVAAVRRDYQLCREELAVAKDILARTRQQSENGVPVNNAIGAAVLSLPELTDLPEGVAERYPEGAAEAFALIPGIVQITAASLCITPSNAESLDAEFFETLTGRSADFQEAELARALHVACVDHTPAVPSSLAALSCYSGGASLKTALAAGILTMADVHAGAGEGLAAILRNVIRRYDRAHEQEGRFCGEDGHEIVWEELGTYIVDFHTGVYGGPKRKIPGFGHRHYGSYGCDPRAQTAIQIATEQGFSGRYLSLALSIEETLKERKSPQLCINIDGVIGALVCELQADPRVAKALFIVPRCVGILGQLLEQKGGSFLRLSNESIDYRGPATDRVSNGY